MREKIKKEFYARKDEENSQRKQLLKDHIDGVKKHSEKNQFEGFSSTQKLIALIHDMGKMSNKWQNYLLSDTDDKKIVPHSPYGSYFVRDLYNLKKVDKKGGHIIASDVIEFVIKSHHGIIDALTLEGNQLLEKQEKNFGEKYGDTYKECKHNLYSMYNQSDIENLFEESSKEFKEFEEILNNFTKSKNREQITNFYYNLGFITRMLLSGLIDADWSDSASFYLDLEKRHTDSTKNFSWENLIDFFENELKKFKCNTELNKIRKKISDECKNSSERKQGIYTLEVPA